jgi:UDP-glucuronate 4-epimerase
VRAVLVAGGAGFVGSHVCGALLERGFRVVCLDSFDDASGPAAERGHVAPFARHAGWTLVEADVRDAAAVTGAYRRYGISATVHLAARTGGRASLRHARLAAEVGGLGTLNLLEAAHRWGAYTFVLGSTAAVYGAGPPTPWAEDATPLRPVSPAGAAALAAEALCHTFHHLHGVSAACLRLFTVYGPRQRRDMAVRHFAERMLGGEPIPRFGDGSSARDYVHVDDAVAAILAALDASPSFAIANIGSGVATPLSRLIDMVAAAAGAAPRIEELPDQPGDPPHTCADIEQAQRLWGWRPAVPLEDGLVRFVAWLRTQSP